jgi:long-chain fatty acid transport protein
MSGGQCAQACRLPYSLHVDGLLRETGDVKYLLSPADLCGLEHVPALVAAGVSWRPMDRLRLAGQVEWIGWSSAFDELPVQLSNGSSIAINGVVGGSSLLDVVPLNWKDRWVFRAGAEYRISTSWVVRAGYAFGESPVPSSTLTPMNAALMEHTATAGAGYEHGRWSVDLAHQYDRPSRRDVGTSGLLSGEYSNSSTKVSVQTVALTARYRF